MASDNKKVPVVMAGSAGPQPTAQEYRREQARLRDMIEKQKQLSKKLAQLEDTIVQKEATYLESSPAGNIITGYDNYIKGTSGAAAQRRKLGSVEQHCVFSRSSISYRPNTGDATPGSSTPASHAPTPLSTSFKEAGSSHATPTSATIPRGVNKKKKNNDDDSETEVVSSKKRTNFGVGRK
ncbi:hypothetical protein jhhlp_001131 [Lomentospora prolificans]|uniref:Chromatin modification-related protein EAF6 n=1 Tax=Lomentospora prolificans TaxID=41688 RepID=A0A2N3NHF2_9PEZI|nr:hypothetical protein jhhlp_001131 [Lomentospora prolificans]